MSISSDQVRHIAHLARLHLTPEEVERFSHQLSAVFDYMEVLNEVDTTGVVPTSQVTGLQNVDRTDEVRSMGIDPQDLLKCSPLSIQDHQIRVRPVF